MLALLKQHVLYSSTWMYISILLFLAAAYFVTLPPIFLFLIVFLAILISLFIFDHTGKMNRYLVSLPISKKRIVQSRHVSLLLFALILLLYQWVVMIVFSAIFETDYYVYGWRDIVTVLCLSSLIMSFSLPLLYYFQSVLFSISIILVIYFLGTFFILDPLVHVLKMDDVIIFNDLDPGFKLLVEKYIPFQPYTLLCIFTLILLFLSMKLSEQFYTKREF
ncbi:ABC-2 transporter permease [Virgibacillus sp. W0181]|uniref:ABC-2 transporter permease n=1 Tax=Virgibacillus sp. W0181 TaxID=3391581 RepID=UPI003F46ECBC